MMIVVLYDIGRIGHYLKAPRDSPPAGRPSDHFYFEAETAKTELINR